MHHALGRRIISGELHYPRFPPEYWRARIRMAAAMGLDAISTYVFWNVHEPQPGRYRFNGAYDVLQFIQIASSEGLGVILRPGPYVCAEWDFGGLPAWLIRDETIAIRTSDERFMRPLRRWLQRLGDELAQPLGDGTIIAVQLENEYGAYAADEAYLPALRGVYEECGFGSLPLFTIDQPGDLFAGALEGVAAGVTFAPGDARDGLAALQQFKPAQAPFCAEYWAGWFDHWGEPHESRDDAQQISDLDWMLAQGTSVNFYMLCGGTNFGFWNGANYSDELPYRPDTTSYDYLAAIDEAGRPRDKYFRFREIIARHRGIAPPQVPASPVTVPIIGEFSLNERAPLFDLLGEPVRSEQPLAMESLQQGFGYVIYRTQLHGPVHGTLTIEDARDYAVVLVNGFVAGRLDRRTGETSVQIDALSGQVVLEIVVENSGRLNYGRRFAADRKGICGAVLLDGREITDWECYAVPMDDLKPLRFTEEDAGPLTFFRGFFELESPGDTFLDTRALGKGTIWINGHHAGRFWSIGPQQTLYVPGVWLRHGLNEVIAFDLEQFETRPVLRGLTEPLYGVRGESARS